MLEFYNGNYAQAIDSLAMAESAIENNRIASISEGAAGLIANDNVKAYSGANYEDLYIKGVKALSYYAMGDYEDSLVEIRRANIISRDFFAELDRRFSLGLLDCSFAVFNGLDISSDISMLFDRQGRADDISSLEMEVIAEAVMLKLRRCERRTAEMCSSKRNEVYRIMSYIEENLRDVTLSSLASHFNLSEQYASRMVKERTGQLFSAIVRKLRMEEACRLLMNDKLSIKE